MPTVIIYWSPGRSQEQKADVVREVTDALVDKGGARREDVLIIFQDIQPGNFARSGTLVAPPALTSAGNTHGSSD